MAGVGGGGGGIVKCPLPVTLKLEVKFGEVVVNHI